MSVYKPKKSPYFQYDFVWKGARFHGSTGLKSKREALAYESQVRSDAILGTVKKLPITIDEACGLYQDHAETLPSWKNIEYMLAALIEGFGPAKLLSDISQFDLQRYFAGRRDGRANSSVNKEIENCRSMWRYVEAAKRFDTGEMPQWSKLFLKVNAKPPRELSLTEEPKLFEHLRVDMIDVCDFALKSGWRQAEVFGLRWKDVDFDARQAITKIKGGDTVRRPLTPTLIAIIANQPKVGPFVFTFVCQQNKAAVGKDKLGRAQPGRRKGQRYPMTKTAFRGAWAEAKKEAKVEDLRFHDLRHTRGTRIVRATGSLAAAKEALKHKSIKTTLRYAHVLDEDVRNALDASESRTIPEAVPTKKRKA